MLPYLRLVRIPNVFTAAADVLAGYLLVRGEVRDDDAGLLLGLILASCLLYMAGMVLNDLFDLEIDRQERPRRPLPSGDVPLLHAQVLGAGMLLGGVALAWGAPSWGTPGPHQPWAPPLVALLLAICVLGYDGGLKRTPAGPAAMGACRGLNLLLGMSAVGAADAGDSWLGLRPALYLLPLGSALYITGLTWFARDEAGESRRPQLRGALAVLIVGLLTIACLPLLDSQALRIRPTSMWYLLIGALGLSIVRPFVAAVADPQPSKVQAAIKHGIFSLITLDAAIALGGARHPMYALAVLALMFPARTLGRWVYST